MQRQKANGTAREKLSRPGKKRHDTRRRGTAQEETERHDTTNGTKRLGHDHTHVPAKSAPDHDHTRRPDHDQTHDLYMCVYIKMYVCVFVCMCKTNKTNKVIAENKRRQGRKQIKQKQSNNIKHVINQQTAKTNSKTNKRTISKLKSEQKQATTNT